MYKQLLNNGFTIKQHIQKTDSRHLRLYFAEVRFI